MPRPALTVQIFPNLVSVHARLLLKIIRCMIQRGNFIDFVADKFPCPAGYDAYLKQPYGNYMRIPKEGERAAHSFRAYWRDEA